MSALVRQSALSRFLIVWFALGSLSLVGCRTVESEVLTSNAGSSVSFYDPGSVNNRCSPPQGLTASEGIAPAEGMFGITCTDNWTEVPDAMDVKGIDSHDIQDAQKKDSNVKNELDYLRLAYKTCPGTCVKMTRDKNGYEKYEINQPNCKAVCSNKTYTLKTNLTGDKSFRVFLESACAARHWKNVFKDKLQIEENKCGRPSHITISQGLISQLGFDGTKQWDVKAYVVEGSADSGNPKKDGSDKPNKGSPDQAGATDLSISFYDPSMFGDRCPPPAGLNSSQGISPAEGLLGVTCSDNWVTVSNPWTVQDVEPGDIQNAKDKGYSITSKFDYLNLAYEKCKDVCVKRSGSTYQINLPACSNVCQGKTYKLKTNLSGDKEIKVFIESACPARHWKNVFKAAIGIDSNHCAKPSHIDVSTGLVPELGFDNFQQHKVKASVK